ncbi:MAG: ATP-binding protein [Rhizomicrobium sp.]|jgi:signal transduction histidine kinase
MSFFLRRFVPRTLGAQLIIVTALAVLVSNASVAVWYATTRARETESALYERVLDRGVSVATLLSTIPARERVQVARAMSSGPWRFHLSYGKTAPEAMTDEEGRFAERARAMLPANRARQTIFVHFTDTTKIREPNPPSSQGLPVRTPVVEVSLPVVRAVQLETLFFRSPFEPWPDQIIIAAFLAIITTSVGAALIASRVTRPMRELASSASLTARGGTAQRVSEQGPEDVSRAARAFNAMNDQVKRTLESQRQLLSAVGHDLRTPITAMRISTEFVADEEVRERIQKNLDELQQLTEAVLDAARGAGWEQMRKIDLSALIESLCTDLDEMGKRVTWRSHSAAPYLCRPNEIRRAVRNLIENAIAYGQEARVCLDQVQDAYMIKVKDNGPGIPEAEQVRVFEPFVRLETSRSAETGGTGLGLTLVKAIAEGHGGSITLENRAEGGLQATLRLPRDAAGA